MSVRIQLLDNHLALVRLDTFGERAGQSPAVARAAIGARWRGKGDLRVAAGEDLPHCRHIDSTVGEEQQPFDHVPQFANVAGPCVADELVDGAAFETARLPSVLLRYLPRKML